MTLSSKQLAKNKKIELAKNGGLIRVSFTFDGKEHVHTHRLTQQEMEKQQELLREFGVDAFSTAMLRVSIWGASRLGEHVVTEAFKDYARKHFKEPSAEVIDFKDIVDQIKEEQNGDSTTPRDSNLASHKSKDDGKS